MRTLSNTPRSCDGPAETKLNLVDQPPFIFVKRVKPLATLDGASFAAMLDRRTVLLLALPALLAPGLSVAQTAEKKKGGGLTYVQFPTLTATVIKSDGRRGVLTLDAGVDVPNAGLRSKVNLVMPRLRAAYVQLLQAYVYSLNPGAPPDPDTLSMELQHETDRVLGQPGAKVLLGAMLVN